MLHDLLFRSENLYVLRLFLIKIQLLLNLIGEISTAKLPKRIKKMTIFRSTHVNKKSKEQFELRKASFFIKVKVPVSAHFLFREFINFLTSRKPPEISFKAKVLVTSENSLLRINVWKTFTYSIKT